MINWLIGILLIVVSLGWAGLVWFSNMMSETGITTFNDWKPIFLSVIGIAVGVAVIHWR